MAEPTLTALTNQLIGGMPPTLLRGLREIAHFTRMSPSSLQRYRRVDPTMPLFRWGRFTFSDRTALVQWLMRREQLRRARKRLANPS